MKAKSNEKKKKPSYATAVSNKHERIENAGNSVPVEKFSLPLECLTVASNWFTNKALLLLENNIIQFSFDPFLSFFHSVCLSFFLFFFLSFFLSFILSFFLSFVYSAFIIQSYFWYLEQNNSVPWKTLKRKSGVVQKILYFMITIFPNCFNYVDWEGC